MGSSRLGQQSSPCNCINLRRASLSITEIYDQFLEPGGLKNSQYSILAHLKSLAPVSVSDLALALRLDRTSLVRSLKPLEEQGLIADAAAKGARTRQLLLTDSGKAVLEKAHVLWDEAQSFMESRIGKEDLQTLTGLLARIEALAGP